MNAKEVKKLTIARALLFGARLDKNQIDKPLVAIVYSQNEICPGHIHLSDLADFVRRGIESEGGTGIKINAGVGVCDGIAMGHEGMKYSLPSRDLNRDAVVTMIKAHGVFDGVVYLGACDKNLPGYLLAAATLKNMPGIFVTAGAMLQGNVHGEPIDAVASYSALLSLGKVTQTEYDEAISSTNPTVGTCAGMFSANSMACMAETLGLTVPGMATANATCNKKYRLASESGRLIMKLIKEKVCVNDILTKEAFHNALTVAMAIGVSTNTMLHIPDIAKQCGYDIELDQINKIGKKTPSILKLSPANKYSINDFDNAGGMPIIMKRLQKLLYLNARTVNGKLQDLIKNTEDNGENNLIKTVNKPYSKTGGISVYKGNLAPEGSVIKESAVKASVPMKIIGTARVFDSEENAISYMTSGKLKKGDVIVIRYEGPAGGPGMREMLYPTAAITGLKMDEHVVLLTDGRFSGATVGICIGHIQPEAYNRGPIAFLKNGDKIEIDREKKEINILLDSDQWQERQIDFNRIEKVAETTLLQEFRRSKCY